MSEIKFENWIAELDRYRGVDPRRTVFAKEADDALLHLRNPEHGKPVPWGKISEAFKKRFGYGHTTVLKRRYKELMEGK